MIGVEIIADSMSHQGIRLTTVKFTYPKFIHAELMTHRVFSRNAGSSRAIPVKKLLAYIKNEPAEPIHWGLNEKGMQSRQEATGLRLWLLKAIWRSARRAACRRAWLMDKVGGHKQIVNRIVESHGHINVLVTSTYWANFFALRDHPDADPTIRELARVFKYHMQYISKPVVKAAGEWHLPYVTHYDKDTIEDITHLRMLSVARCARTSYMTVDGQKPTIQEDIKLYKRLAGGIPIHASPLEHQATPDYIVSGLEWANKHEWGNFYGWRQFRKTIPRERTKEVFEQDTQEAHNLPRVSDETERNSYLVGGSISGRLGQSDVAEGNAPRTTVHNVVAKKRKGGGSNRKVDRPKRGSELLTFGDRKR